MNWEGQQGSGPNHCEEGGGGTSHVRKALFLRSFFFYLQNFLGIHTIFFTIESDFFSVNFFGGGQPLGWGGGGHVPPVPPRDLRP